VDAVDRRSRNANDFNGSDTRRWTGRLLSAAAVVILIIDAVLKLIKTTPMTHGMVRLGFADGLVRGIGAVLLICIAIHVIPRTALLGAILLTAYLGGGVAAELRAGNPLFSNILLPVYVALMLWGGLYLRDDRLRVLNPFRGDR
jgi:hypothetical protein